MATTLVNLGVLGVFPEVCYDLVGELWLAYEFNQQVFVWKFFSGPGTFLLQQTIDTGPGTFPKMGGATGRALILRDHEIPVLWTDVNTPYPANREILDGAAGGNDPVGINKEGGTFWIAWQRAASGFPIRRRLESGGAVASAGSGAPTGISRVLASGGIVLVDADRVQRNPDTTIWGTRPSFAETAIAAETFHGDGSNRGVTVRRGIDVFLWPDLDSFTPRLTWNGTDKFAVATWGAPGGVRVAILDLADLGGPGPGSGGGSGGSGPPPSGSGGPGPGLVRDPVPPVKRPTVRRIAPYPHVPQIADHHTQQSVRLLWERTAAIEENLATTSSGLRDQLTSFEAATRAIQTQLEAQQQLLLDAQAVAGVVVPGSGTSSATPGLPDGGSFGGSPDSGGTTPGAGPGGPGPAPPPGGGGSPTRPLPFLLAVVQDYAAANPAQLANSCQPSGGTWDFMDGVVDALRAVDSRFGYNGKRGNVNDPSNDALAYYWGEGAPFEGATQVHVVDIIAGHCGPNPQPAWTDVTGSGGAGAAWISRGRF